MITKIVLTMFWLPSAVFYFQSVKDKQIRLEFGNTTITEDGVKIIESGGKCGSGQMLAFHLPQKGWFVASVEPFPGYEFQQIGRLEGNKLTFQYDNRKYEMATDQAISNQKRALDLWVVRIGPPADKVDANSKSISCASDFKYWLEHTLTREVKE